MKQSQSNYTAGIVAAGVSYIIWGILPIYWKLLGTVSAVEVLAHRVIWSLAFMILILILLGKWKSTATEIKQLFTHKRQAISIFAASIAISINWLVYIFAVENAHVVEVSLGYFIGPLLNIFLATVFLHERLKKVEWVAVAIAATGVMYLTVCSGSFPWVALMLAITFSCYGLIKKKVDIVPWTGITLETFIITPFALAFLCFFHSGSSSFWERDGSIILLLMGAGVVTVIPLLLFATGAKRVSFTLMGFLQYIAPTIILLLGLFAFGESFTVPQFLAFSLIWIALIVFSISKIMGISNISKSDKRLKLKIARARLRR